MDQILPGIAIRLVAAGDEAALFSLMDRNRERLREYFPGTTRATETPEETAHFVSLRVQQAAQREGYCFVLEKDAVLIGLVIIKEVNWRVPKCELAYCIDAAEEGKGIITAAVKWIVQYCFRKLKMEKICIMVNPANEGSRQVAMRNGFTQEGHMRNEFRTGNGLLTDVEYYGLLKG